MEQRGMEDNIPDGASANPGATERWGDPEYSQRERIVSRVGGALVWGQLLRVFEIGSSLLFLLVVVRRLGPFEYGVFGMITSITGVGDLVATFGFGEALNRFLPQIRNIQGAGSAAFVARRVMAASVSIIAAFCLALWAFQGPLGGLLRMPGSRMLVPILVALTVSQTIYSIFAASNTAMWRMKVVFAVGAIVNSLAALIAIPLVVMRSPTAESATIAAIIAFGFGSVAYFLLSRHWWSAKSSRPIDMKPIWRFAVSAWFVRLSVFIVSPSVIVLMMGWLLGKEKEVAYFSCAYVPLMRLQTFLLGWALPVLLSLSELRLTRGAASSLLAYRLYVKLAIGVAAPVLAYVALYAGPLVASVFGRAFLPAGISLQVYAGLTLVSLLAGSSVTTPVLYSLDMAGKVVRLRIGTAIAHLALVCTLIPRYGALGGVIAMGITAVVAAVLELLVLPKAGRREYPVGFAGKVVAISATCLAVTLLFPASSLLSLAVSGTAYMVLYAILLALWKPLDQREKDVLAHHPSIARLLVYL